MTLTWGRSPKGEYCLGYAPCVHWQTTTFVYALSREGLLAQLVLDGPINGQAFFAWAEQFPAVQLRPGDIVVMDNLSFHKVAGVQSAIKGAALRYLPPYSPDFNPIKPVFTKLKTLLRGAQARCSRHSGAPSVRCWVGFLPISASAIHPPLRLLPVRAIPP